MIIVIMRCWTVEVLRWRPDNPLLWDFLIGEEDAVQVVSHSSSGYFRTMALSWRQVNIFNL